MKRWSSFLFTGLVFYVFSPNALWAVDDQMAAIESEQPVFQNETQLKRALNLTAASFTEDDMEAARQQATEEATEEINTLAENYADGVVDQIASDYAYEEVKQLSRDHALNSVDTEDFPNLDERATYYADKYVEEKANEYASSLGFEEGTPEYEEAYNKAIERGTDPSFYNLWDTAYAEAISKALDEDFSDWEDAYNYAYDRGTAEGDWDNAWETAHNYATEKAIDEGIWQESFDYAIARATNPDYPNAYQAVYKKALQEAVVEINAGQLKEIYQMRYVYRYGWGVITKKLGLKAYHNGLGNLWKHDVGPSIEDEIIPPGPPEEGELLLEQEIAQATRRNTKTGWGNIDGFKTKGNNNKGSKKEYGLAQVSGLARDEIRGKSPNSNGKKGGVSSTSNRGSNNGKKGGVSSTSGSNNGKKGGVSSTSNRGSNNGKKGGVSSTSGSNNGKKGGVSSSNRGSNSGKKGGASSNNGKGKNK